MSFRATPEQQAIIDLDDGCFLVEAPPGSGKTQVLTERVRRLLHASPNANFRVLALTFTTKAAETLRERVEETAKEKANRVYADTFHGFSLSVLRAYGDRVSFPTSPTIYERAADRRDALARAIEEEGFKPKSSKEQDQILARISSQKRALRLAEEVEEPELAVFYRSYQRILLENGACDFDDLLLMTWRLLKDHPRVAEHYRQMYKYILIDEAQDTSRVQYEILKALCAHEHRSVMIVADKSQGIYGFAGASPDFLDAFVADFGANRIPLTHNFRSAESIVKLANELVAYDDRLRKPSIEAVGALGHVDALVRQNEEEEAGLVVRGIQSLLLNGLRPDWCVEGEQTTLAAEEIAVLGRNRYCLGATLKQLQSSGVPHFFGAGEHGLFESPPVRLFVDGLRLIGNSSDHVTRRSLGKTWAVPETESTEELFRSIAAISADLKPTINLLLRLLAAPRPVDINPFMLEGLAILKSRSEPTSVPRREPGVVDEKWRLRSDVETLEDRWAQYRGPVAPEQRTIGGFLGALSLSGSSVLRGEGVRVLTIHAAKGLEFRAVFLVGMNEGTLPDYRAMDESGIREERRSTYVAITRAARLLIISRPATRLTPWGESEALVQSRFIGEMKLSMTSIPKKTDRPERP